MHFTDDWDQALALLGEVLESRRAVPCHLVVCGGAALRATAVISRVTKDVDVLAARGDVDGEMFSAWPLSDSLQGAVADVATELGLPANWLNASTSLLVGPLEDLPSEVWSDLYERSYGSCLRIAFVGRTGQIPLKLHAAVGRSEAWDLQDLEALAPVAEECRRAARWLRGTGLDAPARRRLDEILTALGHGSA